VQLLDPIVSEIAVEAVRLFEVPVMLTLYVPVAAEPVATNVRTLEAFVGLVPKETVTPGGNCDAARLTLPLNPPDGVTVIVSAPLPPCGTTSVGAEGASVNADPEVMSKVCVLIQEFPSR